LGICFRGVILVFGVLWGDFGFCFLWELREPLCCVRFL